MLNPVFPFAIGDLNFNFFKFSKGPGQMLSKALSPLPAAKEEQVGDERIVHSAFSDPEARYRQRYADLAVNPEVRDIFRLRAKVIRALQNFLDDKGFLEVETPILTDIWRCRCETFRYSSQSIASRFISAHFF